IREPMTRPQTVQDVFDALRRDRLVESARLSAFAERHSLGSVDVALARLVADGLLTPFQAGEVAAGNGATLWLGNYRVLDRLGRGRRGRGGGRWRAGGRRVGGGRVRGTGRSGH